MALVGDSHRYQKILLVFSTFLYIEITLLLLGSPFIFMNPIFKCDFAAGEVNEAVACPHIEQCKICTFLFNS
jgi:hypothetical protein